MQAFVLEKFAKYFRDQDAYNRFVAEFEEACAAPTTPFISNGKILGITVSPEFGKEILAKRLIQRLTQDPGQLDRLIEALDEKGVPADDILR